MNAGTAATTPSAKARLEWVRPLLGSFVANGVFLAILLVSAGKLSYWPAWAYAAIGVLMSVLMRLIVRKDPDLSRERAKPGPGAQGWDKRLLGFGFLLTLATLVIAGLDAGRFNWSPRLTWPWSLAGFFLSLSGTSLFLLALRENRYFSAVVRIQSDRGHTVCSSGPYRAIRHPGNAGMILGTIGLPLLLMSAWSAIPAALSVALLIERTRREDAVLEKELAGYRSYQQTTRFRLLPGLW